MKFQGNALSIVLAAAVVSTFVEGNVPGGPGGYGYNGGYRHQPEQEQQQQGQQQLQQGQQQWRGQDPHHMEERHDPAKPQREQGLAEHSHYSADHSHTTQPYGNSAGVPSGIANPGYEYQQQQEAQWQTQPREQRDGEQELEKPQADHEPSPLPEGWSEYVESNTGRTYYHNSADQTSTWKRPQPTNSTQNEPEATEGSAEASTEKSLSDGQDQHSTHDPSQTSTAELEDSGVQGRENVAWKLEEGMSNEPSHTLEDPHHQGLASDRAWGSPDVAVDHTQSRDFDEHPSGQKQWDAQGQPIQEGVRESTSGEVPVEASRNYTVDSPEPQATLEQPRWGAPQPIDGGRALADQGHQHEEWERTENVEHPKPENQPQRQPGWSLPTSADHPQHQWGVPHQHYQQPVATSQPHQNMPPGQTNQPAGGAPERRGVESWQQQSTQHHPDQVAQPGRQQEGPSVRTPPHQVGAGQQQGQQQGQQHLAPDQKPQYQQPQQHQHQQSYQQQQARTQHPPHGQPQGYNQYGSYGQQPRVGGPGQYRDPAYGQHSMHQPNAGGQMVPRGVNDGPNAVKGALGHTWQNILGFGSKTRELTEQLATNAAAASQSLGEQSTSLWDRAKSTIGSVFENNNENTAVPPQPGYNMGGTYSNAQPQPGARPTSGYPQQPGYQPQPGRFGPGNPPQPNQVGGQQQQNSPQGGRPMNPRGDVPYPQMQGQQQQQQQQQHPRGPMQSQYGGYPPQQQGGHYSPRPGDPQGLQGRNPYGGQQEQRGQDQQQASRQDSKQPDPWAHPGLSGDL